MDEVYENKANYWQEVTTVYNRQRMKGISKYGEVLEDNTSLNIAQRLEHLEEELIDGLMYIEHLKAANVSGDYGACDYQRSAFRTANMDYSKMPMIANAAMGLSGEAGEVTDLIKKHLFQGHELDREKLIEELGDVLWYVALACTAIDAEMSDVMRRNIEKLARRYPDGFDKSRSVNRNV